jgi:hypothetical protein
MFVQRQPFRPGFSELAANRESDGHVQNAGTDLPTT